MSEGKVWVKKTVRITPDQDKFLSEHPSINLSGMVREEIDRRREKFKKSGTV